MKKNVIQTTIVLNSNNQPKDPKLKEELEKKPEKAKQYKGLKTIKKETNTERLCSCNCPKPKCPKPNCPQIDKKQLLIGLLIALIALLILIAIILVVYYFMSLGLVAKGSFCMSNYSCLTNGSMYCNVGVCDCLSNYTWNSTKSSCVSIFKNTTYSIESVLKMFYGALYTTSSITSYSGTSFNTVVDVKSTTISNVTYYYITDFGNGVLVIFDSTLTYRNRLNLQDAYSLDLYGSYLYISSSTSGKILKYDTNFTWYSTYSSTPTLSSVRFASSNNYTYACESSTNTISAFDSTLNKVSSESFSVSTCVAVAPWTSGVVFVGSNGNQIFAYLSKSLVNTYTICGSGSISNIYIDVTGYMIISCFTEKKIYLYFVSGTTLTYSKYYLVTTGNPMGLTVDSLGRLVVAMQTPNRVDIFALS